MPHVDITMYAGRDDETKKKVAEAIADAMMKELGCAPSHLSVAIHDKQPENWNDFADTVEEEKVYFGKVFRAE